MKKDNIIQEKSYRFAIRIVNLYKYLLEEKQAFELAKQVLRSGTSIGANIEEAIGAQSKKDFVAKCSIAYKEAREAHYWIRLLRDTTYIDRQQAASLLADLEEILKISASILKTSKNSIKNEK
jgi:four helix bundle protein